MERNQIIIFFSSHSAFVWFAWLFLSFLDKGEQDKCNSH